MTENKNIFIGISPEIVRCLIDVSDVRTSIIHLLLVAEICNLHKVVNTLANIIDRTTSLEMIREAVKEAESPIYQEIKEELEKANDIIREQTEKEKNFAEDFKAVFGVGMQDSVKP